MQAIRAYLEEHPDDLRRVLSLQPVLCLLPAAAGRWRAAGLLWRTGDRGPIHRHRSEALSRRR